MQDKLILKKIIKILEEKKNIHYKYKKKIYNFKYLDLGYVDSLELISFVFNIEKNFKIRIYDNDFNSSNFGTIGGLIKIIKKKLK